MKQRLQNLGIFTTTQLLPCHKQLQFISTMFQPVKLTKSYIRKVFAPLSEIKDIDHRKTFFNHVASNVKWTMMGPTSALAGTRYTLQEHNDATFNRCLKRLTAPIKFKVLKVVIDVEDDDDDNDDDNANDSGSGQAGAEKAGKEDDGAGRWAVIELIGESTRKTGASYDNVYAFMTRWNEEGKMVEIRTYYDTLMAEQMLQDPVDDE